MALFSGSICIPSTDLNKALTDPYSIQDLYVLRRAIGVYEQLVKRFTAQTTDYQELLSTFAEVN